MLAHLQLGLDNVTHIVLPYRTTPNSEWLSRLYYGAIEGKIKLIVLFYVDKRAKNLQSAVSYASLRQCDS